MCVVAHRVLRFTSYDVLDEADDDDETSRGDEDVFLGWLSGVDGTVGRDEEWGPEFYPDHGWAYWPAAAVVETWSAYERRWIAWENANERWWDRVGLDYYDDVPPAAWEPGSRSWVEGLRPASCVHCNLNPPAYSDGSCRTCYGWLARNRERYPAAELVGELHKRVAVRRAKAVTHGNPSV